MKLVQCDENSCGRTAAGGLLYGNPPPGWIVIEIKGGDGREQHYCSARCVVQHMFPDFLIGPVDASQATMPEKG